jgi:hypothetical protein
VVVVFSLEYVGGFFQRGVDKTLYGLLDKYTTFASLT